MGVCKALKKAIKQWTKKEKDLSNVVDKSVVIILSNILQGFLIMETSNAIHESFNFLVPERSKSMRL